MSVSGSEEASLEGAEAPPEDDGAAERAGSGAVSWEASVLGVSWVDCVFPAGELSSGSGDWDKEADGASWPDGAEVSWPS